MSDTQFMAGLLGVLVTLVSVFVFLLKRKSGNGHTTIPRLSVEEEIARNIALIEREDIDLPRNWRSFIDARIEHKTRNLRANAAAYAALLERGHVDKVIAFLKEDAEE